MTSRLETLDLTAEQLMHSQDAVRRLAYDRWQAAGRPRGHELDFLLEAEREWISRCYVPNRPAMT